MGLIKHTKEAIDLNSYIPEYNDDDTEKHILCDGARFHVVSWHLEDGKAIERCSEPKCEINKHGSYLKAFLTRSNTAQTTT